MYLSSLQEIVETGDRIVAKDDLTPEDRALYFDLNARFHRAIVEASGNEALTRFTYELRARGYLVAVDDFGAHASRMQRVRALAPDIVKFDGALVKRLMGTDAGVGTLRMLIERFHRDGMQCVLEGLEALWEITLAESTGAAMVQGYVLAAPRLAGPDLAAWVAQYKPAPERQGERMVKTFR